MQALSEHHIIAKCTLPPIGSPLIARPPRLYRLLEQQNVRLVLLSALAGAGKTSLLRLWAATTTQKIAWVSLDPTDNDPLQFWSYVLAALQPLMSTHPPLVIEQHTTSLGMALDSDALVAALVNGLVDMTEPLALVLDDYHVIEQPAIHQALLRLIDYLPPTVRIILATRQDPPFALARLRAQALLAEIRSSDLRFTTEEVQAFLHQLYHLDLSAASITRLVQRTEGWVAGLRLAALLLSQRADPDAFIGQVRGSQRYIFDYLMEEVLAQIPKPIQRFLLTTCILERFCAPLCDALQPVTQTLPLDTNLPHTVADTESAQHILQWLEQANLFVIPLDDERSWYRYHHLFAECLLHRLERIAPDAVGSLAQCASVWYQQQEMIDEAIRYAFLATDSIRAADLIDRIIQEHGLPYRMHQMLSWVTQLPPEVILEHPRLCLIYALVLLLQRQEVQAAQQIIMLLAQQQQQGILPPDIEHAVLALRLLSAVLHDDGPNALLLAQQAYPLVTQGYHARTMLLAFSLGMAYQHQGDYATASQILSQLVEQRTAEQPYEPLPAFIQLAHIKLLQGELHQVARLCSQVQTLTTAFGSAQWLPASLQQKAAEALLGCLSYEWGMLDTAAAHFANSITAIPTGMHPLPLLRSYGVFAAVQFDWGYPEEAYALLDDAARVLPLRSDHTPIFLYELQAWRVTFWLRQGRLAEAKTWRPGVHPDAHPSSQPFARQVRLHERLVYGHLLLASGEPDLALTILDDAHQAATDYQHQHWRIEALLLKTLAHYATNDLTASQQCLAAALDLGEPGGYIQRFVLAGEPIQRLLTRLQQTGHPLGKHMQRYINQLVDAGRLQATRSHHLLGQPLIEPLSERELEVLHLIAQGHTNRDIAHRLVIVPSTVKAHAHHIYAKLGVTRRTQAVARARALGLLTES